MQNMVLLLLLCFPFFMIQCTSDSNPTTATKATAMTISKPSYAIVIHGGAGVILKKNMTPEREASIRAAMDEALDVGETILKSGGSALDAVEQAIVVLENSPHFNAGKGAVFTNSGENELDASFMEGRTQNAGAVGGVTNVKNPIKAARAVMERSEHVMLSGSGAEAFAREQDLEIVDSKYFFTQSRWESLQKVKAKEGPTGQILNPATADYKYGTVGCAALDLSGNLAAGTSTGGMTNKRYNRIGDSPIIGAGTYANNATCAVSCTGHGEYFIRYAVAHDVSALMEYKGVSLQEAAEYIVNDKLVKKKGNGGLIAVDAQGNVAMPFNTPGMYRGYAKAGERVIKLYKGE